MSKIFDEKWPEVDSDEKLQEIIRAHPSIDPAYINMAVVPWNREKRVLIEKLLLAFEPFADSNFSKKLKTKGEFLSRCWEMIVGTALLEQGHALVQKNSDQGPDIKIKSKSTIMWVEAISCTLGTGSDAVPELSYGSVVDVPFQEMILRIGSAIRDKKKKYDTYLKNKIIGLGDPFVIALSKGSMVHPDVNPSVILRYLYGTGDLVLRFPMDAKTGERIGGPKKTNKKQEPITKRSGENVPVAFFEDPANAGISAVIYCANHIFNQRTPLGSDFVLVPNSHARVPLSSNFLALGAEWVLSGNKLVYREKSFIKQASILDSF